jgi:putative nucleotidyltransferase with HDIG domain
VGGFVSGILLVGQDRERARGVRSLLRQDGHDVTWTRAVPHWRDLEQQIRPDLVVAAVSSTEAVFEACRRSARGFPAALLFVQHDAESAEDVYLEDRLVDRLVSPFDVDELLARVDALIRLRGVVLRGRRDAAGSRRHARGLRGTASRIAALLGRRVPRVSKPREPYLEVVNRVAEWADRRDMFEPGHAERVTSLSALMADGLGLPDSEASALLRAAMLHDIGKVAVPVEVLQKQGPLEDDQMRLIRTHPERGAALLRALDSDDVVANAIRYHHERVDGKGYYGKDAKSVPRAARILAVAETYDAMTTSRVRETVSSEGALSILQEKRYSAFDADCVDALVHALRPRPTYVPLSNLGIPPIRE